MSANRLLSNVEIASRLIAYAQTLEEKRDNPFKIRAYRRAAASIKGLRQSLSALLERSGTVPHLPGVGPGISRAIQEIVSTGTIGQLSLDLVDATPEIAIQRDFPRLDARRLQRVIKKLKLSTAADVKTAHESGRIKAEFGARMADHFHSALREREVILLDDADTLAAALIRFLLKKCGVQQVEITGSMRRRVETVEEISFVVESGDFPETLRAFALLPGGIELIDEHTDRATFQIPGSVLVSLHRATKTDWGSTLATTTGSGTHVTQLRKMGGLAHRSARERDVYTKVGMNWVPPELREGNHELVAASHGKLPRLVEIKDITGDLHMHTVASDGLNEVEEMAMAAQERGYSYIGITDHSQSLRIARGVSERDLRAQLRRIDRLNAKLAPFRVLKSAEVDILVDGKLDYSNELLAELDYTVCSIHSRFALGKKEQTERILRAMDSPYFTILGHATGRLILTRSGYELDFPRVIAHARKRGCFFEINADPDRLDLAPEMARAAAAGGIKIAIGTDAHRVTGLQYMRCGIDVARRAWLTKRDVLNALPLAKLLDAFRRT